MSFLSLQPQERTLSWDSY